MDLEGQANVKRAAEEKGRENLIVLLGSPTPDSAKLYAETVSAGDPTFAGPLAGIALALPVYHILEPEVKHQVDPSVYNEQVGLMETVLETDKIIESVRQVREGRASGN
jgi:glycine/sarcosine/betaine reductase complex component A